MEKSIPYPVPKTLDSALGFELIEVTARTAQGRFGVGPSVAQPFGLVHGGAFAAMAESLASYATFLAVEGAGNYAVGQANNCSFLRPVTSGQVHAFAEALHSGRSTWVWDVRFRDDEDRLCAVS